MDKVGGGGHRKWISDGGSPKVDKLILNVNIINFKKVDKPRGGIGQRGLGFFVKFKHI